MRLTEKWNYDHTVENIAQSEKLMTDNGVTFADPTPQELAQWREVMKPVYQNQPENIRQRIEQVEKLKAAMAK